jgi:hypothetical protein
MLKNFALVLPSYVYNPKRKVWADAAFASLLKTDYPIKPYLILVEKETGYQYPIEALKAKFHVHVIPDNLKVTGTETTLCFGTTYGFQVCGTDYAVWLGDDALFHPQWLKELNNLIGRHPNAQSWSVYHSSREDIHRPLVTTETDIQTTCLCGHGLTWSKEEWKVVEPQLNWDSQGSWPSPAGDTIDLWHSWQRPGERWCTRRSYIDHTGTEGAHVTLAIQEHGIGFTEE